MEKAVSGDYHIEVVTRFFKISLRENFIYRRRPHAKAHFYTRRARGGLASGRTGVFHRLIHKVRKFRAIFLVAVGIYVCDIMRSYVYLGLLGDHTRSSRVNRSHHSLSFKI